MTSTVGINIYSSVINIQHAAFNWFYKWRFVVSEIIKFVSQTEVWLLTDTVPIAHSYEGDQKWCVPPHPILSNAVHCFGNASLVMHLFDGKANSQYVFLNITICISRSLNMYFSFSQYVFLIISICISQSLNMYFSFSQYVFLILSICIYNSLNMYFSFS